MARLRARIIQTAGRRGELVLYKFSRATEMTCVRCAAHSTTRWAAVCGDDWTKLWYKSCFLAMPPG